MTRHVYRNGLRTTPAFTLVELLVSIAVLTLLVVFVTQLVGNAATVVAYAGKHTEADSTAREVLDRMARDFAGMTRRVDLDYAFNRQTGPDARHGANDSMFFYAHSADYYGGSVTTTQPVSLVGYRVKPRLAGDTPTRDFYQLERLGFGLTWANRSPATDTPTSALAYLPTTLMGNHGHPWADRPPSDADDQPGFWASVAITNPFNSNVNVRPAGSGRDGYTPGYEVTGDQVFRLEYYFRLRDGTRSQLPVTLPPGLRHNVNAASPPTPTDDRAQGYVVGSRWYYESRQVQLPGGAGATLVLPEPNQVSAGFVCRRSTPGAAVWERLGLSDVSAVVVAVATLDERSRKLVKPLPVPDTAATVPDLGTAVAALADFGPGGSAGLAATWQAALNDGSADGFAAQTRGEIPRAALGGVHVYERHFFLGDDR